MTTNATKAPTTALSTTRGASSLEELIACFDACLAEGDAAALADLYADGAVLALGSGRRQVGRSAIGAAYASAFDSGLLQGAGTWLTPVQLGHTTLASRLDADGRLMVKVAHRDDDGRWFWIEGRGLSAADFGLAS